MTTLFASYPGYGGGSLDSELPFTVLEPTGSDDTVPIQSALDAVVDGGWVQLTAGAYTITSPIVLLATSNNVTLAGVPGATIITSTAAVNDYSLRLDTASNERNGNNITKGNTSITYTTHAQAIAAVAGDYVIIKGNDINGEPDAEYNIFLNNGNTGTGVADLTFPIARTMTGVTIVTMPDNKNITIRDLALVLGAAPATFGGAIIAEGASRLLIDNVTTSGYQLSPDYGAPCIELGNCIDARLNRVLINGTKNDGLRFDYSVNCAVHNSQITKTNQSGVISQGSINFDAAYDCLVDGCVINDSITSGITSRILGRRNRIANTYVENCQVHGMRFVGAKGIEVDGCTITDCWADTAATGIYVSSSAGRIKVSNTTIERCRYGVYVDAGDNHNFVNNNIYDCLNSAYTFATSNNSQINGGTITGGVGGSSAVAITGNDNQVNGVNINTVTGKGIELGGTSARNQINGNKLSGVSSTAILLGASTLNNQAVGNMAFGLTITDSGTNNSLADNKVS